MPPQAQPGGATPNRQSAAYEDLAPLPEEEFRLDEEELAELEARTPPTQLEVELEEMEQRLEDSPPPSPLEEDEMILER